MNPPTLDLTTYDELAETAGAEFAAELAATFMEEAPTMLTELRRALSAGDADAFRRAAHSLKSNGNTFGAAALAGLAKDLELGGLPADAKPLDAIEVAYAAAEAALKVRAGG